MKELPGLELSKEIKDDLKAIAARFGEDARKFEQFAKLVEAELYRIRSNPEDCGAPCRFEPLASAGYRKVKFYSDRQLQRTPGAKPDLRIIYRYLKDKNLVQIFVIAPRINTRPRQPGDAYEIAKARMFETS